MTDNCKKIDGFAGRRYRTPRKKTRLEKLLIVICALLMFVLIATTTFFAIALYFNLFKQQNETFPETICNSTYTNEDVQFSAIKNEKKSKKICNSHLCIQQAARIIENVDFTVHPCKNFYRFACGNYMKNSIPNTLDYNRDFILDMEKEVNHRIKRILENLNQSRSSEHELRMRKFYKSCIDMREKSFSTRKIVENILQYLQLEWSPMQPNTTTMYLEEQLAVIMAYGGRNPLFYVEYEGMNTVMLQESKTILQEEYLLSEEYDNTALVEYRRLMIEVFTRLGFSNTVAKNEVEGILEFETSIAEIARDHRDDAYTLLELSHLENILPSFKWIPLFRYFFDYLERVEYKARDTNVVLQSPGYLEELIQLLHDTKPKIVENYILWSFLFQFLHIFDASLTKHYHILNPFINQGIKELSSSDWEACVLVTKTRFRQSMSYLYAKEVLSTITLKEIEEIDKNLKDSFGEVMQSENWKSIYDNNLWKEQEKEIILNIPFKDFRTSAKPPKKHPNFRISADFIENIFQIEKEIVVNLVTTGSLQDIFSSEDTFLIRPLYEDITYELPLSVFQFPYIAAEISRYMSYAALGFPLAKKLSRQIQELDNKDQPKFAENTNSTIAQLSNCYQAQYSEFLNMMQKDEEVNTSRIIREYMHSNIGIHVAFEAYKKHVESHGTEDPLPGLAFEPDQLFFIHHATLLCEVQTEDVDKTYLQNKQIPAEFSVNGGLQNSEEFAKVYNCPVGSNMNPRIKCAI